MTIANPAAAYVFLILAMVGISDAKRWRGLVPLHSTCEDAKRLLGINKCETGSYDFENERAFIWFAERPCVDGWNVPPGTVTSIKVYPKQKRRLTDLRIDEKRFRKEMSRSEHDRDRYINEEEGLVIAAYNDGQVESITYIPTTKDNYLRFPNSLTNQPTTGGDPHSILKFDEYGDLKVGEDHKRLTDFALQLRSEPTAQAYIIAYAGRRARAGEAKALAWRAKNYLVKSLSIKSARIVAVDGGYRGESTVELFLGSKDAEPIPSPTVCPSDVQIIKNKKVGRHSSRKT